MHSTERSQSQVRAQKLNDVDSIDSTGPVHATTASSECNVSEPVGLDSVRPTKRATQVKTVHLGERNQRRKFRTETHPQAGWACDAAGNYCEVQTLPPLPHTELHDPTNLYYPFESEFAFEFAKHAQKYRLSESQFNNLIRIHKGVGIDYQYANRDAYRAILDKVPSAKWTTYHEATLKLTAPSLGWPEHLSTLPFLLQSHTFWVLDTAEVLCHLLSSPIFSGHQTYAPQEHFEVCKDGTETQFYSEPHTGTKAWNFQVSARVSDLHDMVQVSNPTSLSGLTQFLQASLDCLRDLGIRINTSHDATALSAGTGTASAHPIYLSLSINAGFLKREDRGGLVLIGFFPKLTRTDKGNDELWRMYCRRVKHCILEQLWQPIKRYLSGRHLFQFADGHHRFARVYFGPTAVDYPDACWLTGVASGNVVCYDRKHSELHLGPGTPRTSTSSASLRAEARQVGGNLGRNIAALRKYGLNFGRISNSVP
ncbi:BQ5605_C006g04289 [Microbotryum silenes-dioicae]|uniref:BQ5605_C006g04282 protein n=1 Tax=Microbotryum silenes-dioicae TaxID=796604 RepID=A0A2X0P8U4_9BASI|nr:BQ5605_C006g04282 [Microbotryum silenes-dioicae]SGY57599.1 BQ5605_C006g04289 [Microbotryum silenes-dioicae]